MCRSGTALKANALIPAYTGRFGMLSHSMTCRDLDVSGTSVTAKSCTNAAIWQGRHPTAGVSDMAPFIGMDVSHRAMRKNLVRARDNG